MLADQSLAGQRFLVIDDEPDNLIPLQLTLEHMKVTVHLESNGSAAVRYLHTATPDLILLDLSMPEMNGWETLKAIRTILKITSPVIAMTAHAMEGDRDKVLQAGFDGYISKPFRPTQIAEEITGALRDAAAYNNRVVQTIA